MAFIKNNLFLIAVSLITLLVGGGALGHYLLMSSGENQEKVTSREDLARKISALGGARAVNAQMLEASQKYVKSVQDSFKSFQAELLKRNQASHVPFVIETAGQKIAVFPYDKEKWAQYSIPFLFQNKYKQEMQALLERAGATSPPSATEIADAARRTSLLMAEEQKNAASSETSSLVLPPGVAAPADTPASVPQTGAVIPAAGATPAAGNPAMGGPPPGFGGPPPGFGGPPPGFGGPPPGFGGPPAGVAAAGAPAVSGNESPEATRQATDTMKVQKANGGQVYAAESSFNFYQLPVGTQPSPDQMWMAQVNCWLQRDIVDAIVKTNQEIRQRKSPSQPLPATVLNSGVKRLVSIQIAGYEGDGQAASSTARTPDANLTDCLTRRGSNPTYDVLTSDVTLIVDMAYLPTFIRNLESQNFNTVLKLDLDDIGNNILGAAGASGPGYGNATASEDLYYYGTEPVMRVTLKVESLFFCDWERPLMPVEMLKRLPAGAMRPEDSQRTAAVATPGT